MDTISLIQYDMYHRYFEPIFDMYQWYFSYRVYPTNWNLRCWTVISMHSFYGLNTTFSASKLITNLNCVFISYTSQRLCYYNANYNENIVLLGKWLREWLPQRLLNRKSLELSHSVTISRLHKIAEACSLLVNTETFNTVHSKRHRFLAFIRCFLSKAYRNEYWMDRNSKTGIMI